MSMYGFNRAALNGGVSGIIAGAALALASSSFTANPTRTVYPDAAVPVVSSAQADGRLALQAQAQVTNTGTLTANGVRIALGDGQSVSTSNCTADGRLALLGAAQPSVASSATAVSFTVHGGAVGFTSVGSVSATPAVEMGPSFAQVFASSGMTAAATALRHGACEALVEAVLSAEPHVTAYPSPIALTGYASATADGRLALLGAAQPTVGSSAEATGTHIQWAAVHVAVGASTTAVGRLAWLADATISVSSGAVASGTAAAQILTLGVAVAEVRSSMTANVPVDAAAPDPDTRTMTRLFVSKDTRRPFVDRDMRRLV
jgi:hypothetical protein